VLFFHGGSQRRVPDIGAERLEKIHLPQDAVHVALTQVRLGPASNGFYSVLGGLKVNDEVVKDGSFILKAEAIRQHPELQ